MCISSRALRYRCSCMIRHRYSREKTGREVLTEEPHPTTPVADTTMCTRWRASRGRPRAYVSSNSMSNSEGVVLGCIANKRSHFSILHKIYKICTRSYRSKLRLCVNFAKLRNSCWNSRHPMRLLLKISVLQFDFDDISSEFPQNFTESQKILDIKQNSLKHPELWWIQDYGAAKKSQKFRRSTKNPF